MKTIVVVNPQAGKRMFLKLYLPQVLRLLEKKGVTFKVFHTRYPGHAARIVQRHRPGLDFVTVFGGDGTVREVVKGLGEHPLPLGIIPFGTVNVLALDLGLPLNPVIAAATILEGQVRKIDVGYLNGEPFLLMVSTGLDAVAVHNVDLRAKRYFGRMAYVLSALWSVFTHRARKIQITIEDRNIRDRGYLAIISNSRYYAGPYKITDQTKIDDGLLNVILFKKRSISDTLRLLIGVLTRRHKYMRDVAFYQGKRIQVSSRSRVKMQMDGDKAPPTPASVWVKKHHLPVFVPKTPKFKIIRR